MVKFGGNGGDAYYGKVLHIPMIQLKIFNDSRFVQACLKKNIFTLSFVLLGIPFLP